MITFKNIAGNKSLAVGTIQRKSALNGEKSLSGTLYDGKDVLNKIDKGWSLEFDGEPYVVTYFERNDNDNSVSFDAIHKFFWDMAKKVLYSSTEISGSHTIKWYLEQIFANTGYTYALNFSPGAVEKDNWGNKTRLSLFNDLITSIAGEFEINGTLISIFQNIGTDLSTIVRYGFNLSDMTLENDATSFVTYGEGFGAYADQENQTGDRVHVTYTSPLAGVYGILQAEPIDDQRYTSQANLQAAVKAQVDASFSVSVQLSLYDLTAAGYPYKMANVGDWLTAVDENLDFKQRIRIISIDDEFSADGTKISYTVTAGDIGLTKKYQDANASMASQVANAIVSAGQASTDANFALIAANGKLTAYYVGSYDELPTTANEGDLGWVTSGDGRLLYIYTKKADGSYYWEKRIDPEMGDQIAAGVTEAVAQAKAHTDEVKQSLSTDISTAKSQAASQASTAEANAKSAATSQFNQAQSALSAAKTDLTNSIASEASARNQAVAAANSQAQTYANQAKADAMSAASSADGAIRTAISSSANSLSATITQNKSSADSGISTAQTTANAAVDGLAFKVSKTDYDQKTGDLSTKINDVKETADSSAQTIADIKTADGKQDARMSEIENTASGIKSTVSDLSTAQGKQSGYISELQQSAQGFVGSIRDINNVVNGLGQTNQLFNTEFSPDFQGWFIREAYGQDISKVGWVKGYPVNGYGSISKVKQPWSNYLQSPLVNTTGAGQISISAVVSVYSDDGVGNSYITLDAFNQDGTFVSQIASVFIQNGTYDKYIKLENITIPSDVSYVSLGMLTPSATVTYKLSQPMLVFASTVGTYAQGNYNNNSATAKAQLTADNAALAISDYKTNADGRISQAQSDIKANADAITAKVSKTDYDQKTGDLTQAVSKAQATADGVVTTVGNYQTSNDKRVKAAESAISQNADAIALKVAKTDYDSNNSQLNTRFTKVEATANGASTTVSDLQQTVNDLGQVNLVVNSELKPDLAGWAFRVQAAGAVAGNSSLGYSGHGALVIDTINPTTSSQDSYYSSQLMPISEKQVTISYRIRTNVVGSIVNVGVAKATSDGVIYGSDRSSVTTTGDWQYIQRTISLDDKTSYIAFDIMIPKNVQARTVFSQPMINVGARAGAYVSGQYNNNAALAQVKVTAEGISNFVRDSNGNLSSNFQDAFGKMSIVTGSNFATSIKSQTATQITSALTDNNGRLISLINQDSSGVQIAGKNIVLNGDTTVTGAFKVSQANIANGAIGTAQIGDAAITNAKIADLDVSKITGNVSNFIQSYWNGVYASTSINANGLSVQSGSTVTTFDSNGAHFANNGQTAHYEFGRWNDVNNNTTSSSGLYLGATGNHNSFIDILAPSGAASVVIAGTEMNYGNNTNIVKGAINLFYDTNVRSRLLFKGNNINSSTYIEANEVMRTLNFYTDNAKDGNGNWFYFNHKVLSTGTFSSTSLLSKKNVIANYEEDALGEISKTDIVEFEYKNDVGEKHISPIIDDVNDEKDYYIPKTILGQDGEYVDMYSMISMAWKAIQQLNEKIGEK